MTPDCTIPAGASPELTCDPPATYSVLTYPRHQHRWFYCGPATVQVISNLTWNYFYSSTNGQSSTTNKYKQSYISSTWTMTDRDGYTALGNLIDGMNEATVLPWSGFYAQWNGPTWSEFHNSIITDTWNYELGLAAGVNPRKTGSNYYLYSWRNVGPGDYGHYIALYGYSGSAQSTAKAYYDDSSGGYDEVTGEVILGSTGAFTSDRSYTVCKTMMNRYGNLVW